MDDLKADLNSFSPPLIANFLKIKGEASVLSPGDEFEVKIPGPWSAPVKVMSVGPNSFRLSTLDGHIEAGEINFSLEKLDDNRMRFKIESEARSRDAVVDFLYDKVGILKLAQSEMWKLFCENFASLAAAHAFTGQQKIETVNILTEKQDVETKQWTQI